ncbi:MAG: ABC transporter substrate-binding protein, partial [Anaerolineae bacterium]|nr:ABC transporter substrate-binding protein [Anaerolineae bacterium]
MNRHKGLPLFVLGLLLLGLLACHQTPETALVTVTETPLTETDANIPATLYHESPMLTELVVAGELPSVDSRLPAEPTIIITANSIGEYGGIWHTVTGSTSGIDIRTFLYDPPIRWKADLSGYLPGLATYEWSDNGETFTLHFKKGLKWSDGADFTMEDVAFWWQNLALNSSVTSSSIPIYMFKSDGKTPIDMEFPDEITWTWKSDQPLWIAPYMLAQGFDTWQQIMKPKHFLQAFHPDLSASADYASFMDMDYFWKTPGYPCLFAWCLQTYSPEDGWIWVRNPFYWKVDTVGNQLPYIDYIKVELVTDSTMRTHNIANGLYDAAFLSAVDPLLFSNLQQQARVNGLRLYTGWLNGAGAWPGWIINQNYDGEEAEAEEISALLRNKWFRKGLSLALDRNRFNDIVWQGLGIPQQATISPQSPHFAEDTGRGPAIYHAWKTASAGFDVKQAEFYFEKALFMDQDGDGWRDLPGGAPFELSIDVNAWEGDHAVLVSSELVKEYWEVMGIKVRINNQEDQLEWVQKREKSTFMVRNCSMTQLDIWTEPELIFPLNNNSAWPLEGRYWQSDGKFGIASERGSSSARLQNLFELGLKTSDSKRRNEILWQAIQI